jgi:transposase
MRGKEAMTALTEEKRALIISAKERGETEKEIAKWLEISRSSVCKIWKLCKDTGSYARLPYHGKKTKISEENRKDAEELLSRYPDKTLEEIIEELSLPIRKSRLSVLLIKAGYSFKKRWYTLPDVIERT